MLSPESQGFSGTAYALPVAGAMRLWSEESGGGRGGRGGLPSCRDDALHAHRLPPPTLSPPSSPSPLSRPVSGRRLSPVARPLCAVQTTEGISDLSGPDLKLERLPVGDPAGSRQVPTGV